MLSLQEYFPALRLIFVSVKMSANKFGRLHKRKRQFPFCNATLLPALNLLILSELRDRLAGGGHGAFGRGHGLGQPGEKQHHCARHDRKTQNVDVSLTPFVIF